MTPPVAAGEPPAPERSCGMLTRRVAILNSLEDDRFRVIEDSARSLVHRHESLAPLGLTMTDGSPALPHCGSDTTPFICSNNQDRRVDVAE